MKKFQLLALHQLQRRVFNETEILMAEKQWSWHPQIWSLGRRERERERDWERDWKSEAEDVLELHVTSHHGVHRLDLLGQLSNSRRSNLKKAERNIKHTSFFKHFPEDSLKNPSEIDGLTDGQWFSCSWKQDTQKLDPIA